MLEETLEDHDFKDEDIGEVKKEVLSRKNYIVIKK